MFFPFEAALAIDRAEPGSGVCLRKRELVRNLQFLKCLIAFDFGTRSVGFPKPKYKASFGHTLTQSMHFMQPGSTTIPYCFTSAWTSAFEVHVAVQCPH